MKIINNKFMKENIEKLLAKFAKKKYHSIIKTFINKKCMQNYDIFTNLLFLSKEIFK